MATRFWVWHVEGYVRLALTDSQTLRWSRRGPDDEGWSSRAMTWTLEDGIVTHEEFTDGVDCDGRHSTHWIGRCPVNRLDAYLLDDLEQNPARIRVPEWNETKRGQRDYAAEAMGS